MNSSQPNRKWHWIFWIIYSLVNHLIFTPHGEYFHLESISITLLFTLINAITAYITFDCWFTKFYKNQQYLRFIVATFLTIFVFGTLLFFILYYFSPIIMGRNISLSDFSNALLGPSYLSNLSGISALFIPYLVMQRITMERRNRQLEKEKLAAELKFLKSQLHPHFLFNALNNIYFLIKKDPDTAAEALAGFSNLLRFQLYEANNESVALEKEITYLQQFAEIAQLRKGENFKVNWTLPEDAKNVQIAPLLLMPLIENAFKHGRNKNGQIDIALQLENQQLHFKIINSKEIDKSKGVSGFAEGGIGLVNIQKRLQLLYPEQHEFFMKDGVEEFMVSLKIDLKYDKKAILPNRNLTAQEQTIL